jgi:recombination protein RecA
MKEKKKVKRMSTEKEAKLKALLTLDKLDKTYGKGTVMKMGDKAIVEVETISSGSLGIDLDRDIKR